MFGEHLTTPVNNKYRGSQWSTRKDKSMTFSQLHKSPSGYKSTELGSHSPYQSGNVSRLEEARKTIDSVICDLEDQKDLNQSAFREVNEVNYEVLGDLRRGSPVEKENAPAYAS